MFLTYVGCQFFGKSKFMFDFILNPEAEFKEFEPRFKLKLQLKYGWFHLKLY